MPTKPSPEAVCLPIHQHSLLQIWVDNPAQNNFIALPDASGVFVVQALAPLSVDTAGTVALDQSQIEQVGQLAAGSIGRTFGTIPGLYCMMLQASPPSPRISPSSFACILPMSNSVEQCST